MQQITNPTTFARKVYALCAQIPEGKVSTYKEIATVLGIKSSQAVGQALRCNPFLEKVPCHRVISSTGNIGGFKGHIEGKEITEKIILLQSEGVIVNDATIDLSTFLHTFKKG
ncbi:TPA: MGMT family protein [Candidatus Woesearchaeota archaeon]|nr:methyltransferase [archaeon]HIJ10777.1 MGMT family protein [Candidatus Woesearchaeota archaeon]